MCAPNIKGQQYATFPEFLLGRLGLYHFGFSWPRKSDSVLTSCFSGFFEENQPLELAEVVLVVLAVALDLGALSNGLRKLVVLFQVFLVPLVTLPQVELFLAAGLGLALLVIDQLGHQLFFAPVDVTPLAAGALVLPNQPSLADTASVIASIIAHAMTQVITQRRFICASPANRNPFLF